MKSKKKYLLPQYALAIIEEIAEYYDTTKTQALIRCIEKGGAYYQKIMRKGQAQQTSPAKAADQEQQQNDITQPAVEKELSEEMKRMIKIAKTPAYD